MVVGALSWVMATSGRVVVERFLGLAERSFGESYDKSGRAGMRHQRADGDDVGRPPGLRDRPLGDDRRGLRRPDRRQRPLGRGDDPRLGRRRRHPAAAALQHRDRPGDARHPADRAALAGPRRPLLGGRGLRVEPERHRDVLQLRDVPHRRSACSSGSWRRSSTPPTICARREAAARRAGAARGPPRPPRRARPARCPRPTRRPRPDRNGSVPPAMPRLRVAIVADYPEEGWPSMDLIAEMVLDYLARGHAGEVEATRVCPPYRRRLGRLPGRRLAGVARNADRVLNRFVDYPRHLRRLARRGPFDVYHIIDHSYAQLALALPPGRAVVTCHDLDTFRCLLRPDLEPRPAWFRALARRSLRGLQAAAAVPCVSEATRSALLEHRLVPPERLTVNYQGVAPEFSDAPDPEADAEVAGADRAARLARAAPRRHDHPPQADRRPARRLRRHPSRPARGDPHQGRRPAHARAGRPGAGAGRRRRDPPDALLRGPPAARRAVSPRGAGAPAERGRGVRPAPGRGDGLRRAAAGQRPPRAPRGRRRRRRLPARSATSPPGSMPRSPCSTRSDPPPRRRRGPLRPLPLGGARRPPRRSLSRGRRT